MFPLCLLTAEEGGHTASKPILHTVFRYAFNFKQYLCRTEASEIRMHRNEFIDLTTTN